MSRRTSASGLSREDNFLFTNWSARSASDSMRLSDCLAEVLDVSPCISCCIAHFLSGESVLDINDMDQISNTSDREDQISGHQGT